jgi:serine/threonine-protein kinase
MTAHPISGTALDVTSPFFSPDGQWIGFFAFQDLTIKKIAATGGAAFTVCKAEPIAGADWQGDHIVFAQPAKGIMRVSANGGEPETIAQVANDEAAFGPRLIDRGTAVLYTVSKAGLGFDRWDQHGDLKGGHQRMAWAVDGPIAGLLTDLPTGHIVYALASSVLAIPFDLKTGEAKGGPVPVVESVMRVPNSATQMGIAHFATSATGALAYVPGTANGPDGAKLLSFVERDGKTQPIALPPQMYVHPRLSPDGTQIAVGTDDGRDSNVWVYDRKAPGASLRRLTFGGRNRYPIWSPDGRYIAFQSDREGDGAIFRQLANGSGAAERLTKPDAGAQHEPESWSPDGKTLSFNNISGANQGVWTVGLDGDRKPVVFADSTENTVEKYRCFAGRH